VKNRQSGFLILSMVLLLQCFPGRTQDRELEYYLTLGVANNPVLKDLSNRLKSNRYDSLITRATYLPQVNFNGYLMAAPVINGWGYSDVITNGQQLSGSLSVNQQFFNKKTREANYQAYSLESRNLDNSRILSSGELKKAITAQYLAAYSAVSEKNFQLEVLATLKEESRILQAWVNSGIYRQTDFLSFRVEIFSLERNVRDLDLQFRREFSNLNLICGVSDTVSYNLVLPSIEEMIKNSPENSPFFQSFRIDSLKIQNEKLLIDRSYKPAVYWFSDGGIVNNEPRYLYRNFGVSFGLSMTLPVFDGNQRKFKYGKIRVQEETRKNYQEFFRIQFNARLKQLMDELETIRTLALENEKQILLIKELVNQDRVLFNKGTVTITDYILAMKNLIEARQAGLLYQIRTQYLINEINFWKQ
jgi:outer membrane protein TolC